MEHASGLSPSIENWHTLLDLLCASTIGQQGREAAWTGLCFVLDSGLLDTRSFAPSRLLLLRFLHSAYPDDNEDGEVEGPPKSTSNPFLQPAMSRLVGLLAMLLGGYVEQANSVVLGSRYFPHNSGEKLCWRKRRTWIHQKWSLLYLPTSLWSRYEWRAMWRKNQEVGEHSPHIDPCSSGQLNLSRTQSKHHRTAPLTCPTNPRGRHVHHRGRQSLRCKVREDWLWQ